MDEASKPKLGQVVKIIRGRETEKYAIVIGMIDQRFVWIADGDKRKFDQPKKKNILHLQFQECISKEVVDSLSETGRVTNGKLRYALNKFVETLNTDVQEKGE